GRARGAASRPVRDGARRLQRVRLQLVRRRVRLCLGLHRCRLLGAGAPRDSGCSALLPLVFVAICLEGSSSMSKSHRISVRGCSTRRTFHTATLSVLGSIAALGAAVCIEACGADSETGGQRIALETRIAPSTDATSFTTAVGWNVTLTKAVLATG